MRSNSYSRRRTGRKTISTRVEREMREYLDEETSRREETLAEFLRHLCRLYRHSQAGELACGECGEHIEL